MELTERPAVPAGSPEVDFAGFPASRGTEDAVLILDASGVVRYASDAAATLLRVPDRLVGRAVGGLPLTGRLGELVRDPTEPHGTVLVGGRYIEVRRLALGGAGRMGAVLLLRDRTELVELFAELADVHALVVGLRTRQHEHANRLHVVLGLMQCGEHDAAVDFLKEMLGMTVESAFAAPSSGHAAATLTALLRTKASIAAAREVALEVEWLADLDALALDSDTLTSIVGNLIDNAIDAVAGRPDARVGVTAAGDADGLRLTVRDNGAGVPEDVDVFTDGYTTKQPRTGMTRGFGLALVRHLVARSAGTITVHNDGGAVFTVRWPARQRRAG
jgi:sensor histidine kinase regulating citrate/malate metabolism